MTFLQSLVTPAMEATDITPGASADTANATGELDRSEIAMNPNDILGTKGGPDATGENGNNPNQQTNNDMTPPDAGDAPMDDMNSDDMTPPDANEPDAGGEMPPEGGEAQPPEEQDSEFEKNRKKKLWDSYKAFYEIVNNSIDLLSKYIPNTSSTATIKAMNAIKENLQDAKKMTYDVLTRDYKSLSYPQMEKKYIALNHVYDICTNEMEVYFDKYRENQ